MSHSPYEGSVTHRVGGKSDIRVVANTNFMEVTMVCVICEGTIEADAYGWDQGHNAEPVAQGRCCLSCNRDFVIPARFKQAGYSNEEVASLPEDIE